MIFETIITSIDSQGVSHTSPFGIRNQDGLVIISPYKPSVTLENILQTNHAVMNLTDDVRIFAGALTSRKVWTLVPTTHINGYRLTNTLVHKELKLIEIKDDLVRPQLIMEVVYEEQHQLFQGFNRAQSAVIELAVMVSRLTRLPMEKIIHDIDFLQSCIEKTAGERELEAWGWLVEAVNNHKAAINGENFA